MENLANKLAEVLSSLEIEMSALDREDPDQEHQANKIEEVIKEVKRAYNDLTELV